MEPLRRVVPINKKLEEGKKQLEIRADVSPVLWVGLFYAFFFFFSSFSSKYNIPLLVLF